MSRRAPPVERFELSVEEAKELMKDEPFKLELIEELNDDGQPLSFYRLAGFTDLCRGPHLMNASQVKAFKLTQCTGAYWRGDANREQLCRVYGTAFTKADEMEQYLKQQEEMKKRDHNIIGRQLKYFTTVDCIGQGLALLMPKGARVVQLLQRFVEDEEQRRGYVLTKTPFMAKSDLYKLSGHWEHYKEGMFVIGDEEKDDEVYALRPMTCPFQYMIYLNDMHSYRDLPIRYGETSTLFRNEASGEMHGLIRLRQFTISEGHLILRPDQLEEEFAGVVNLIHYCMRTLGLDEDLTYRFSKWDPDDKAKYIDDPETWERTQDIMRKILDDLNIDYTEEKGEAAFYGPKLDIQAKNVHGKEDTLITVQIDPFLAERFGMTYTDADGEKNIPTSSTVPPSAATSAHWPCCLRNMPAPCPPGYPPTGYGAAHQRAAVRPCVRAVRSAEKRRESAQRWMRETRRSATASARRSWKRCPICLFSATRSWRTGRFPSEAERTATSAA